MKTAIRFSKYMAMALLLLIVSSCEKDNVVLLTDGVWDFSNLTTTSTDQTATTFIAGYKAIHTDATLEFKSDKTYTKNAPLFESAEAGTWELFGDSQIVFNFGDLHNTAALEKLTKNELVYIETYLDGQGDPYPATFKWVR